MPRLSKAKKDVISCEKLRGVANTPRSGDIRMGQPVEARPRHTRTRGRTWGTETSQYPQEEKITMIPQVVASERGRAQTAGVAMRRAGL